MFPGVKEVVSVCVGLSVSRIMQKVTEGFPCKFV